MGLVTNITKLVDIPNETESAVIRKLSHTQLKAAAKVRQSEGVGFMREMGGDLLKALKDADSNKVKEIQEAQAANADNYDRDSLLKMGVVSWSYKVSLPDGTDFLDEPTAKFLAEAVFEFSRPDTPAEIKNG